MRVTKLWGTEDIIENSDLYCMKLLRLQPGFQSSLHYHLNKDETFLVIYGVCDLEVAGTTRRMVVGDHQRIQPLTEHRFRAVNDLCCVVEASTYHDDEDVIRLEESRKL